MTVFQSRPLNQYPIQLTGLGYDKLYFKGNKDILWNPIVAIIGSRRLLYRTVINSKTVISTCLARNWTVANGVAIGCDQIALELAHSRNAPTIGVLGSGLDAAGCLTKQHSKVLKNHGCLLSEYENTCRISPKNLVQRNRLIIALSMGIIVLQAETKGGTAHAIRYAKKLGKPIAVLQHEKSNPLNSGVTRLLNEGVSSLKSKTSVNVFLNRLSSAYYLF